MASSTHRGQALAEFALVLPIVLLLFLALFDFGRAVYAYNTIANATREALRVAIVDQSATAVEAKAREQAVALDGPNLTVDVSGVLDPSCRKIGCTTRVSTSYDYSAITPIIGSLVGPFSLTAQGEMPIERVYESGP